ncbi:MAG: putative metal-binding motif-containing protein, partial [Polyangiales bacterium]
IAASLTGCATGAGDGAATGDDADADALVARDATVTPDGETGADTRPIFPTDSRYDGFIFDAIDDAPCTPGAVRICPTTCGTVGDSACVAGDWGKCAIRAGDPCTGIDCTGKGDGFEHTFYTDADGDGHGDKTKTVHGCVPTTTAIASDDDCDDGRAAVHPGAAEVCDKLDNDCNGKVDDDLHVLAMNVSYAELSPCGPSETNHAACKVAAAAWCRARSSCYDGGFGPVELGSSEGQFLCISGATLTGSWAEVTAAQPGCSSDAQANDRVCESGVNRAARGAGYVGAILQSHAPGDWKYLAFGSDRAVLYPSLVWSDLTGKHAGCVDGRQDTWDCNAATHRYCISKGHSTGYGPVEYNPTNVAVVCLNK